MVIHENGFIWGIICTRLCSLPIYWQVRLYSVCGFAHSFFYKWTRVTLAQFGASVEIGRVRGTRAARIGVSVVFGSSRGTRAARIGVSVVFGSIRGTRTLRILIPAGLWCSRRCRSLGSTGERSDRWLRRSCRRRTSTCRRPRCPRVGRRRDRTKKPLSVSSCRPVLLLCKCCPRFLPIL